MVLCQWKASREILYEKKSTQIPLYKECLPRCLAPTFCYLKGKVLLSFYCLIRYAPEWMKVPEQVQVATVRLVPAVNRSPWRCVGSKLSRFSSLLAKEAQCPVHWSPCPLLPSLTHFPALKPFSSWTTLRLGRYICRAWSSAPRNFPMLLNHNMGFLGLLLHFFKRWEWREYSACSVCYATAPFAPCPLFVSTNMGSKRWKDSKMAKKCDMNVWVGRFKRFCEVREDHKTWRETFFFLHNQSYAPKFSEWIVCHILLIFCVQQYMRSPVCNRGVRARASARQMTIMSHWVLQMRVVWLEKSYQPPSYCSDTPCNH